MENAVFGFVIYNSNNKTNTNYLLFRGIGHVENKKFVRIKEYDYLTTYYGYKKLRNYYDMKDKFGERPCVVLNTDNEVISDKTYLSQKEIAEFYHIKVSKLSSKPFSNNDIVRKNN